MASYAFLTWAPLISAVVWLALSAYLVVQRRYRTWTELFFLGLCAGAGAYALADVFFFGSADPSPKLEASVSLTCLTLASAFLFLYGMSLHGRFRLPMLLVFAPAVVFAALFPSDMFAGFTPLPGGLTPQVPVYNETLFLPWIAYIIALWGAGLVQVTRTVLEVRRQSPAIARRITVILLSLVGALAVAAGSNALLGLNQYVAQPPLFSAVLAIPGAVIFLAATPNATRRLNDAILRRKAALSDVKAAFLTFSDGTLIGSRVQPEEEMIDADSFGATLDVIANFMRTSFPTLRGKWLKSIRHGDYTLVLEHGRSVYLTLVLGGQENDQLRRRMMEALDSFERTNDRILTHWRGVASDASGVDDVLASMLAAK